MKKVRPGQQVAVFNRGPHSINHKVYAFLLSLDKGDQVIIDKEDWKVSTPFSHQLHSSPSLKGKFSCRLLRDSSGWLVTRIG